MICDVVSTSNKGMAEPLSWTWELEVNMPEANMSRSGTAPRESSDLNGLISPIVHLAQRRVKSLAGESVKWLGLQGRAPAPWGDGPGQ